MKDSFSPTLPRVSYPAQGTYLLQVASVFAAYFITGKIGLSFYAVNGFATLIWPPTGIALAALLLWGGRLWPAIALGAFSLNLFIGASPPVACGIAIGNTLEALVGAYLLRRYIGFDPRLARLRDSFGLIVYAGFLAPMIAATVGTLALLMGGVITHAHTTLTWLTWWTGDALGVLSISPFLIRFISQPLFTRTSREWIEGATGFGIIVALLTIIFWTPYGQLGPFSLVYLLTLAFLWAGLRTRTRGMALALLLLTTIGISGTLFGYGPVTHTLSTEALFGVQTLIGTIDIIFLLFVSVVEERRDTLLALERYVQNLEGALEKSRFEGQAKTDFLAILAHELRNPLAAVLSSLELAKLHERRSENIKNFEGMETHIHTMARHLDDLLDISRISQKKFSLQKESIELQTVLKQSLGMVAHFLEERAHQSVVNVPDAPLWVDADPMRLEQVFVNLLTNAGKYTNPGGTITLRVSTENEMIIVSIADTGIGIAPEKLPHVFDMIQSGESAARRPGGLGIGLSLARRLVELHGGAVEARSRGEGHGSEFVVSLPLSKTAPLQLPARVRKTRGRFRDRAIVPAQYRILVVDDNELVAKGMATLLAHAGHTVEVRHDGPEALEAARTFHPEVVVLDIGLPTLDGYAVARALRTDLKSTATLIALTGYGQEEDQRKAYDAGFTHHLTKPVSVVDIESILRGLKPRTS